LHSTPIQGLFNAIFLAQDTRFFARKMRHLSHNQHFLEKESCLKRKNRVSAEQPCPPSLKKYFVILFFKSAHIELDKKYWKSKPMIEIIV